MKTKLTRLLTMLAATLMLGIYSHAQLTVNTSQTPAQLAQLLSGTGVQILNPQVHGGTNSYGKYNATNSNANITEGVILTTGLATSAIGPNNTGSMTTYFGSPTVPSTYPLLTNYTGRTIYEYCEFEFDIIPQGDTISFPFVFGSEEYEEWVCSQFNDVFGFFISGPGIIPDPGAGNYKNIALIPNTNTAVTINSVNQLFNTGYYQNNNNGTSIQYDGFTNGLKAVSAVIPCQVYHLKLIVADASDKLWDSGVFIEKISANTVAVTSATVGGTPFMIEGCNPGTVTFTRPTVTNLPLVVTYWIGGTATNGTDYPLIGTSPLATAPKTIIIPANQASASINITPGADNIADNNEYLTVYLSNPLCPAVLDSLRFYIHDYLAAAVTPTTATVCTGSQTQLTATGDASSFTWTPSAGLNNPNIPNPIATPSVTTTYYVSSNVGSCQSNLPVTITVSNISLSFTHTNINCSNAATGSASVTATGGFPPYTYAWTGPNGYTASTASISNLAAGTYTVVVSGQQNCTATGTVTISSTPALTVSASGNIFLCGYNVTCFGGNNGNATATVTGGTAPYTYSWSVTNPTQTTATATNLAAGTYTVTVTDANGCTGSAIVFMTQPPLLTATITSQTNVICFGGSTGSATVVGGGGVPPYTYSWSTTPIQTTATATNLAAGTYTVIVRDANWCMRTATVTITQPASMIATISAQSNITCFGNTNGSATVSVTGGTGPFTYSWNTSPAQTSATATNLGAGSYVVTVTSANGCTTTATATITGPSAALTATISSQTNATCTSSTGSATIAVTGGTAPYTYLWNTSPAQTTATATNLPPGNYVVIITDANGCQAAVAVCITGATSTLSATISAQTNVSCFGGNNGSATVTVTGGTAPYTYSWNTTPVQTTATATNLTAGTRTVTITDANGCTVTRTVTITQPATALSATISAQTNVSCFGGNNGSATVTATGGTAPYTYSWNTTPVQSTATATNLSAGTRTVTITDANGCTTTRTVTITQPASALSATISAQTNVSCLGGNNGSATVTATGGTAPYSYSWNTTPVQTTATATNLSAGTRTVTITDANGCTITRTVTITQPANALSATISAQTNVSCFGNTNGSATVTATGGTAPYSYSWNNTPTQTSATATNLAAGSYVVTITDANGCTVTRTVTITQPASTLSATITAQTNVSCFGNTNGSATISVTGGTGPYTYSWNTTPTQTTATASNLAAGTYTVTATDANGCSITRTVTITQPASTLSATISAQTNVSCFGGNNGSATVTVTGGTAPYTYSWNTTPVQTTATATNLSAGTRTVTITDANGCTITRTVTITQPATALNATISAQTNVSCFGNTNGSATISVTGGTGPYTYSWNTTPAQTTATASNLAAGSYVVTATDANGCTISRTVTITQPSATMSATISAQTNVTCFGGNNGSATVTITGGTAPYTYSWNTTPAQNSATATNLSAGSYVVTVTDANGCSVTRTVTITQPASAITATISAHTNVSCFGNSNGSATVSVSGGTGPYTYSWNTTPVQTTATINNLTAGSYVVTITDANGCTGTATATITAPSAALTAVVSSQTNVSCFGGNNGSATISVTGGTGPYTYLWNTTPAQTTATATNLPAGNYAVIITDANGCQAVVAVCIHEPMTGLTVSITSQTNVSCFGNTNGSATVAATGGTGPYTYSWNTTPTQTGATASNLAAGTYTVTATDASGCTGTAIVTITQPASSMSTTITAQTNVNCFGGNTGSVTIAVTGGTAPYTYSWNTTPVQTTATASNLAAGSYVVTVTDANGCSVTRTITITQPASAISTTISAQTNVNCFGGNTGSATITATGGTSPYTYSWNTTPTQTSATATNLAAGSYVVTVTDANGCSATRTITITQPAAAISTTISAQTNVNCFGGNTGSATITATGGTAPYTYSWNTTPAQSSATASNLTAGSYVVTVTDANGCSATRTVIITQPASAVSAVISSSTNASCFGNSNGSATVTATGGTAPYTYSWSTLPTQTTATANNLAAGTYVVTVTDANGCTATTSVIITQPLAAMVATVTNQTNVSCFGNTNGSATISVVGGTAPYTFSWNTTPAQTSATANNLAAGTYVVTVTDANNCSVTVNVTITQPASAMVATIIAQTNVSCFGNTNGSATVSVTGGTAPYTYSWNTTPVQVAPVAVNLAAGTYVVTVTDVNGCSTTASVTITGPSAPLTAVISAQTNVSCFGGNNGSATITVTGGTAPYTYLWNTVPVQTTATANNLIAGNYTVIITDANGCQALVAICITEPTTGLTVLVTSQTNVSCFGNTNGSATVTATGGTAPYTYSWNTTPTQTTATASNLAAGTYVVTVTDANGCTGTASVIITQPASSMSATIIAQTNASCFGNSNGTATVLATGGTAPYTYSWNTTPAQTLPVATNLAAGTYVVTVTDANGCTATATVTITQPAAGLIATISAQTNVNCFGNSTGSATVSVTGGTAPYVYTWGSLPIQTTATANNLSAGTYVVTVTDANGCSVTTSVTITQPAAALVATTSSQTNVNCFGGNTGSATISVTGGTAPYTYSWNTTPMQTTATASNLTAGSYVATVTDANGCTATVTVIITQPATALSASIIAQTNASCFGNTNGTATVLATGGTAPYTYSWNTTPAQTLPVASNLAAGTYVVTVTDANGCTATAIVTITQPAAGLTATISAQTNVNCFGGNTGSATITVTGGTAPYIYTWSSLPIQTTATANNLSAGTYVVTVTDANGCSVTTSVTITQPAAALVATTSSQTNVNCFGGNTGSATISVTGGTAPYTYSWNTTPMQTSATASNLTAGSYVATVTDANGCTATVTVIITQPATALSASIIAQTNASCFGNTNGTATVLPTGGTAPYTYSWNTTPAQTLPVATNLAAGTYVVTVTDANGCTATATVTITQPASALSATISAQTNVNCFGNSTGSATVSVTGGTAPYVYTWNSLPIQTTATASNLAAGTYVVTVTDANGCSTTASVTITQPAAGLSASISSQTNVNCFGGNTGSATIAVSGGTGPYTYSWNTTPMQTTATASNLSAGTYIVTVTDASGCTATVAVIITQPAVALSAIITAQTNVNCFGGNTGSATVTVAGGTAPYTYSWNTTPTQTGATANNLTAGTYMVMVTDANGCTASATVTITQPAAALSATISAQTNASCFGNSNGSATVSVTGGTAPYTYSWNTTPLQITPTASNLAAGTYVVTVTDLNGCSTTVSVTITQPAAALSATISAQTNVSCFAGNNGSATVSVSGGTGPYTYAWSTIPAQFTATATNLVAGSYLVIITDSNGCTATATVNITQPTAPLIATISNVTPVSCFGNSDGSATVAVIGGTAPYTYSWNTNPAQTSATANNLAAGNYAVTVTDANGCLASATVTITQPVAPLNASIVAQTNAGCFGDSTGSATVLVTGGTPSYTYSWNTVPTQNTPIAINLSAGTYVVTITDANGCTTTASVTITQPAAALSASISAQTNVNCFGGNTGSATVTVTGGSAPYVYVWNTLPAQTTATASNLTAGTYVVTVTDTNGCSATATVTITEPAFALSAIITAQNNVSCFGDSTGNATITVTGGTAPYTYSWNTTPAQNTATASNLAAGTYMVMVTDSNGCTATVTVIITQPLAPLNATIINQTNVNCFGDSTGTATVFVTGGTAPYTYSWNASTTLTGAVATNLAAGTHTVLVTDANGCTTTVTVIITQPVAPLNATIINQVNVGCFGDSTGTATVFVTGGTGPYTYSWNASPTLTGAIATNLVAGTYIVLVTDSNGCTATVTVTITQPASALAATISGQTNVSCFGNTDGSVTVTVTGGTGPYTYSWNTTPVQTGATATNLAAGSYVVTVTDTNGCTTTVPVIISQPAAPLSATVSTTNVSCNGGNNGSAVVTVTGGTAPYSYLWNTLNAQTSDTATNLSAGNYLVTVTDSNGCSLTVSVTITEPATALSATTTVSMYNGNNISCFGSQDGYIMSTVTGGTAPYTYSWTGPSSYTATSQNISGLFAGTYILTVTDSLGCSFTITNELTQPDSIAIISVVTNADCKSATTGSIDLTVSGGTTAYTYAWTGPNSFTATTEDLNGVNAGAYVVTVTDANGCTSTSSITITQPIPFVITLTETNVTCAGGNNGGIDLTVTGGTPAYSYSWTGPNGFSSTNEDITGLVAGVYEVTIIDANGCVTTAQDSISAPAPISAIFTSIDATCTTSDGIVATDVSGGVGPYTYLWSNGATTQDLGGLTPGAYIVTITDANGCTFTDTASVGRRAPLETEVSVTSPTCLDSLGGSIVLTVTNGSSPYTYSWSTGATTDSIGGLTIGTYYVTTTDSFGCSVIDTIVVNGPVPMVLTLTSTVYGNGFNISTPGGNDGSIDLTVTGGTSPYVYDWSTGDITEDISGLTSGIYSVIVTDSSGCTASGEIILTEPFELEMPNGFSPNADGSNDFFVVQGLGNFPDNHIEIYNRWGNLVYETDNYNNKWNGVNMNGEPLPDATYFVILEVNGGQTKLNTYVDLRR